MALLATAILLAAAPAAAFDESALTRSLDAMAALHEDGTFDRDLLNTMEQTFDKHNLADYQERFWDGFLRYSTEVHPGGVDPWGSQNIWMEYDQYDGKGVDLEIPGVDVNVTIYEPCNWVSNIAYYHTMNELSDYEGWTFSPETVNGLVQMFSTSGAGSSFFHAGVTELGGTLDVLPIELFALLAHQSVMELLPRTSILFDLASPPSSASSDEAATLPSAIEMANVFVAVVEERDLYEWNGALREQIETPGMYRTFGALVVGAINILVDDDTADTVIGLVVSLLLEEEDATFLIEDYNPAFQNATKEIDLGPLEKLSVGLKLAGTMLKLGYSFVWQEEAVQGAPYLEDEEYNRLGGVFMPTVNMLSNALTGFPHANQDLQHSVNVYPGEEGCRVGRSPHAKWHEQSANGLLDLMYLCSHIKGVVDNKIPGASAAARVAEEDGEWLSFWARYSPVAAYTYLA